MTVLTPEAINAIDQKHIWHPYASIPPTSPIYAVSSAEGCNIHLADGRVLIDGMSSWWSAIHGYNHPKLNQALNEQAQRMSHVMFGGFTHEPAVTLSKTLVDITPEGLEHVFLADSGSVAVEVAMKMAIQYWIAKGQPQKHRFMALQGGYHGDTFGAMSVCDPVTGMHHLFQSVLQKSLFLPKPKALFGQKAASEDISALEATLMTHHQEIAGLILEPIVQGAGGMHFYSAEYLIQAKALCERFDVLFIADEIATGFGRTGAMFACNHANISPDILCLGKALTGGYMTLAATLCTSAIATTICNGPTGVFMHGPTFMGNPLACAVANASLSVLMDSTWKTRINQIQEQLTKTLTPCKNLPKVKDVRVLGAIGVVECKDPVDMATIVPKFVEQGIWIRPFGRLVYTMPPFIISQNALTNITNGIYNVLASL